MVFATGVLACNLYFAFRRQALGSGWECLEAQSVRWRLFQTAGKIVLHGRQMILKVSADTLGMVTAIRERCARLVQEGAAVPDPS